ncbi:MAG TPA: class I SAM-dependent methyltransferase [Methylomirabilota bacterium]|jgi:SAM-dependent methyltransferase|nr:class I SAM-dependent methyltransferase [Methylomirabilota bacterium]
MSAIPASEFDRRVAGRSVEEIWREHYEPDTPGRVRRLRLLLAALDPRPGERILDVGCGVGPTAYWAARAGARVVGVDFSHVSLDAGTRVARARGDARIAFVRADGTQLPVAAARFDKVMCVDVMDMLPPAAHKALFAELLWAVRPGGTVLLYTPNAVRERLGAAIRPLRRRLGRWRDRSECPLHVGLTTAARVRGLLRSLGAVGRVSYADMNYPALAALPLARRWLAGHQLWTIRRGGRRG